ncbi:MAG: NHL repeat-containing protein [Acidobacteriaceae bacterium]|nr:NHL repeat-containing protein [Acidobacteriaceae bacterium]
MLSCRTFLRVVSSLVPVAVLLTGCSGSTSSTTTPTTPLTVTGGAYATGIATQAYSQAIVISGGKAAYTCTVSSGAAPSGLVVSSGCVISGTPLVAGSSSFTVSVSDSSSPTLTSTATISILVNPAPPIITTTTLPAGAVGTKYSSALTVTQGTSPYTCSLASGSYPGGLSFASGCTLSGIPTAAGTYSIAVKVTDSTNPVESGTGTVSLTINASPYTGVIAGTSPVIGASVQIYAAGTTGNGLAPTALLTTPLATDASGAFDLSTASYTCPSPTAITYFVATGGKVGSTSAVTNTGSVLMSSVGACSNIATTSSLVINEASTVASAYAFQQFLTAGAKMGATSTNLSGITLASNTFQNLANPASGTLPGANFPSNGVAPTQKMNLLANVMNACLTATSPTGTACSSFYSAATVNGLAPTNTLDAILNLAKNPGLDTGAMYALASGLSTYAPQSTTQPSDWMLWCTYSGGGMSNPTTVTIDSLGRVWVANYFAVASLFTNTGSAVFSSGLTGNSLENSYGAAVDKNDSLWVANEEGGPSGIGTVSVFTSAGAIGTGSPYTSGGLNFPISVAHDTTGVAWVVDYGNSHLTLLDNSGTPLSGTEGYTTAQFIFPVAVAVDSQRRGWVTNQSDSTVVRVAADGSSFVSYTVGRGPSAVAIDAKDNVWTANYYGDTIGLVSSAGTVVSGSTGYAGAGVTHPQGIAIDGGGTPWISNYRAPGISAVAGASTATPGQAISGTSGFAPDADLLEAFGIAIDQSGNLWVASFGSNTLTEFIGPAVPVKTPLIGPVVLP